MTRSTAAERVVKVFGKPIFSSTNLIGGVLSALLGLAFLMSPLGNGLTNFSYDLPFFFRRNVEVQDVVIVYMDLESHTRLGQSELRLWDRTKHAQLLDRLKESAAKAVVFDVLFLPLTNNADADAELIRAVKSHGKVAVAAIAKAKLFRGEIVDWQVIPPFAELEQVASWGLVEVAPADGFIRKHYSRPDLDTPSLAWRAAQLATNTLPDPFHPRWLNYYGPPGYLRYESFWEMLASPTAAAALSNKVVFVGNLYPVATTGGKETDDVRTPYTRWTGRKAPGVEVIATTYLNLVRGDWLQKSPAWLEFILVLCAGIIFGSGLSRCRPISAAISGLLAATLVGVAANIIVWKTHIWFPWLVISAVQVPAAVAWAALAHTRKLTREKTALEQSLALANLQVDSERTDTIPSVGQTRSEVPNYTLLRRVGKGAYGEVWLARDIIGMYHAVKMVHRSKFPDSGPFEREFNGLKRFTPVSTGHPGLVHIRHVGRNARPEFIYYIMEAADDEQSGQQIDPQTYSPRNLAQDIKRQGSIPVPACLHIFSQLADALEYLHQHHLIHRDIKPANIIFIKNAPKLADIGLVTETETRGGEVSYLGTEGYIAPEGPGSPLADVYALGKVLYQAATGLELNCFPVMETALMERMNGEAMLQLNLIILKACENDPARRYQSAAELQRALIKLQESPA